MSTLGDDTSALHTLIDKLADDEVERTAALFEAAGRAIARWFKRCCRSTAPEHDDAETIAAVDRTDTVGGKEVERRYGQD